MKKQILVAILAIVHLTLSAQTLRFTYDASGNSRQRLVESGADVQAPTLGCPPAQTLFLSANCTAALPAYAPLNLGDNCSPIPAITVVQQPSAGSVFNGQGMTQVQLRATDQAGNSSVCSFAVAHSDTTRPQLVCPADQTLAVNADCQAVLPDYLAQAQIQDNCGIADQQQLPAAGTVILAATGGVFETTIEATDGAGNSRTCVFTVTVQDNIPPALLCPANQVTTQCATPINYAAPDLSDNCDSPGLTLLQGFPSGVVFPVGTTLVQYLATDGAGNTAQCSFTVTVQNSLSSATTFLEPACAGAATGSAAVAVSGGMSGYEIHWSNGQSGPAITGLTAGIYTVTITDSQGCLRYDSVVLTEPLPLTMTLDALENGSGSDGSISVTVIGGTAPYQFVWYRDNQPTNIMTEDASSLTEGVYELHVTDAHGCMMISPPYSIMVVSTGGIDDGFGLEVFPNPTTGNLWVRTTVGTHTVRLRLFAPNGQLMREFPELHLSEAPHLLDVTFFQAGTYLLEFWQADRRLVRKVVKVE